jgi:hypothetical protein
MSWAKAIFLVSVLITVVTIFSYSYLRYDENKCQKFCLDQGKSYIYIAPKFGSSSAIPPHFNQVTLAGKKRECECVD